jgi:hypothetical protein
MTTCLNCENKFEGKFCNQCGQKASVHRFTVRHLLHELPHSLFHVDKGILKNIKGALHPQRTIFEYIQGKRIRYYSPFLFFIITTALVVFMEYVFNINLNISIPIEVGDEQIYDVGEFISANKKYVFLLSVFIYALPATFIFKKETQFTYAEHVVANLFMLSWSNFIHLISLVHAEDSIFPLSYAMLISMLVFMILVYNKGSWLVTILKAIFVLLIQVFLFLTVLVLLGLIVAIIKFPDKTIGM